MPNKKIKAIMAHIFLFVIIVVIVKYTIYSELLFAG